MRAQAKTRVPDPTPVPLAQESFARLVTRALAEQWEKQLPIGSPVLFIDDAKSVWLTKTRSEPWMLGDGMTYVILIEGRTGGIDISRIYKVLKP